MANNVGIGNSRVIMDVDGETATVTSNRLDVNATIQAGDFNVGNVDILSVIPGTGATNLGKADDAGHSTNDVGVMALAVRKDALGTMVSHTDDYSPLQLTSGGELRVNFASAIGGTEALNAAGEQRSSSQRGNVPLVVRNDELAISSAGHIDGDYTFFQVNAIGGLYVTGSEVEDAAVQSEPLLIGGRYDASARDLNDGDAGAVALNASGHLLATVTKSIAGTIDTGTQVVIGSSTTEIVDALGDRMAVIIVNDSDETIYIQLNTSAVMNRGIRLNANGGSFSTEIWQGSINGICASGSKNVTVTEISP